MTHSHRFRGQVRHVIYKVRTLFALAACCLAGSFTLAASTVAVTLTPTTATMPPWVTQQFTASVTGATNTAVTWSATGGTISTAGLYTAGPTPGTYKVTATSVQDPTKSATAAITVSVPAVSVGLQPGSVTLKPAKTQQFTATVYNTTNQAVTWSATGGTVTSTGLYTAGTGGGAFSVTATSVQDPIRSATASITIDAPSQVMVTVAPATATVQTGGTQQFTATVTGTPNPAVTWTATGGTISSSGLFTAGAITGTFAVTATSVQDPTKHSSIVVTITVPQVTVTISPTSTGVLTAATKQFTATVTNATNKAVTWTATGGTISTTGLFTAGLTTGTFKVTATSVQNTAKSAFATVTITPAPINVTMSPSTALLLASAKQQFTATVGGTTNKAVTWTATGGTITTAGLFTAGTATGQFKVTATSAQDSTKSASSVVSIINRVSADRPRIILDSATLAKLRSRASANTPQWETLKASCDSLVGGTVNFPGQEGYPDLPNVGEGYQGDGYLDSVLPLGICYQTTKTSDPTTAAKYGAKGVAILVAMSDPAYQTIDGTPIADRDNGYGIRNYGVAMGLGYDWFHDLFSTAQLTQVQKALSMWIHGFETDPADDFEYDHPMGNYFAGYYAAKCMAALAVQGESPLGDTWWNDWYNNQHSTRLAPYYQQNMAGGGWPEGFADYGPLASRNQALAALAVHTAKGIDLIHASSPFTFPLDQARWLMSFTWPSRDMVDDRDTIHSNSSDDTIWPGTADANSYSFFAGYLALWNDPLAPAMHKYARDAKAALSLEDAGTVDPWIEFMFWDDAAPEAAYTGTALSYLAPGVGEMTARSDWTNAASWMSFRSGPYVNNPSAGHQGFDAGSLALVRGKSPLLVNVEGWLVHNPNGNAGENTVYDDQFGNWDADHTLGNRRFYNTFQVSHPDGSGVPLDNFGQWAQTREDGARTEVSRYEDGGRYVLAVGQFIEDMFRPFQTICGVSPVTSWSRQVLYLRPSQYVVYDRTGVCSSTLDQYLAFHFPASPVSVTAPAVGLHRYDVTNGAFAGSMTTILPANSQISITDHLSPNEDIWNKVWRAEIRPTGTATTNRQWLTVFDLANSSSQVASATPVTVTTGAAVGAVLSSTAGTSVTVFGTAPVGTPIAGTLTYSAPAVTARHIVTDLSPLAGYTVAVKLSGSSQVVTITSGGSSKATANGVLSFGVTATGTLQP